MGGPDSGAVVDCKGRGPVCGPGGLDGPGQRGPSFPDRGHGGQSGHHHARIPGKCYGGLPGPEPDGLRQCGGERDCQHQPDPLHCPAGSARAGLPKAVPGQRAASHRHRAGAAGLHPSGGTGRVGLPCPSGDFPAVYGGEHLAGPAGAGRAERKKPSPFRGRAGETSVPVRGRHGGSGSRGPAAGGLRHPAGPSAGGLPGGGGRHHCSPGHQSARAGHHPDGGGQKAGFPFRREHSGGQHH